MKVSPCFHVLYILISGIKEVCPFFSGAIDLSYIDPVVIGRRVFTVTNELVGGVVACVQDAICTVINAVVDGVKGI